MRRSSRSAPTGRRRRDGPGERARHQAGAGGRQDDAEMQKINPATTSSIIKAGTYPKQDKDVPVIGYYHARRRRLRPAGGHGLQDDQGDGET